jgi:hypothetical protein
MSRWLVWAALATVLVSGCGGGGGTDDSATGGATSTGGRGGTPATGTGGQIGSQADLVTAAVLIASCLPVTDDGVNRHLTYLYEPELFHPGMWTRFGMQAACLSTTGGGCQAVEACFGSTVTDYSGGTCEPCSGTVASICGNDLKATFDCGTLGLDCDPDYFCVDGEPPPACDEDTFVPACSADGRPQSCRGYVLEGPVCADLGLVCGDGTCTGTGATCVGLEGSTDQQVFFEGVSCSGSRLVACVEGHLAERDCAAIAPGFSCQHFEGHFFCGLASECVPGANPPGTHGTAERCEGTELVLCNAGRIERVDCTELGFTGCDVDTDSAFGCVPNFVVP